MAASIDNQKIIFKEINAYRVEQGLPPLRSNEIISQEAEQHSREMAEHAVPFGHAGFSDRVHRLFRQFKRPRGAAENVACTSAPNPHEIVKLWLHSPPHKKNIEGNYNLTGIGVAYGPHHEVYATQIFLRS
jgi:uncharacterized protein YkwD